MSDDRGAAQQRWSNGARPSGMEPVSEREAYERGRSNSFMNGMESEADRVAYDAGRAAHDEEQNSSSPSSGSSSSGGGANPIALGIALGTALAVFAKWYGVKSVGGFLGVLAMMIEAFTIFGVAISLLWNVHGFLAFLVALGLAVGYALLFRRVDLQEKLCLFASAVVPAAIAYGGLAGFFYGVRADAGGSILRLLVLLAVAAGLYFLARFLHRKAAADFKAYAEEKKAAAD